MDYKEYVRYEWVIARRAYAAICDYICYLAICVVYTLIFGVAVNDEVIMLPSGFWFAFPIIWCIWFPIVESFNGQTLFKRLFKLRVIFDGHANRDRFAAEFLRRLADPIDFFFSLGIVAVLTVKLSPQHKRLGDMWGGTHVVWEKSQEAGEIRSAGDAPDDGQRR